MVVQRYDVDKLAATFDRASNYFDIIFPFFIRPYRQAVEYALQQYSGGRASPRVLDIGTGTGTLAGAFADRGAEVTGVDISAGMLNKARSKYGDRVTFIQVPAHGLDAWGDQSFDVVSAAFVLHEMPPDYRARILGEMKRLSADLALVVDYIPNYNPVVHIVERVEKSYYRDFLGNIDHQLRQQFTGYRLKNLNHFMGAYLCNL